MKVLVADDDPVSLLVAQTAVQALGHECQVAHEGDRAWELFETFQPQVLLLDREMPGLDGLELCRRARAQPGAAYTYVVLLTTHGAPQDVLTGMRAGADDYLVKPLDPVVLEARLLAARRVTDLHVELGRVRADLSRQARTDPLTGLRNRLALHEQLADLDARAGRYGEPYAVALCDIDVFKRYNDRYGHAAGDDALCAVATLLTEQLRAVDGVYRYGGEEFVAVLPGQRVEVAAVVMERVRTALVGLGIEHLDSEEGLLTLSIGVAARSSGAGAQVVLQEADDRLYAAKRAGRNCVVATSGPQTAQAPV